MRRQEYGSLAKHETRWLALLAGPWVRVSWATDSPTEARDAARIVGRIHSSRCYGCSRFSRCICSWSSRFFICARGNRAWPGLCRRPGLRRQYASATAGQGFLWRPSVRRPAWGDDAASSTQLLSRREGEECFPNGTFEGWLHAVARIARASWPDKP